MARGVRIEMSIPFDVPAFLQSSVGFAGEGWQRRFNAAMDNPLVKLFVMPERLGPLPENINAYARTNRWMMFSALAYGPGKIRFISLWDGKKGDGVGGTEDMVATVRRYSGEVHTLDARALLGKLKEAT